MISIICFIVCITKGSSKNIFWEDAGVLGIVATYLLLFFSSALTYNVVVWESLWFRSS